MSKIILPLNTNPPVKCYLSQAHTLGIIFTQDYDNSYPWLFNFFYGFEYTKDINGDNMMVLSPNSWGFYFDPIFTLYGVSLPFEAIDYELVFMILEKMLAQGFYCNGNFNERYVPGFDQYGKRDFPYQFLLYGIDSDNKTISSFGYLENGKLDVIDISYDDFYYALTNTPDHHLYFQFVKLNEEHNNDCFDINKFIDKTAELIRENNNLQSPLNDFIRELDDNIIDIRKIYTYYEHKFLMYERLKYMKNKGYLDMDIDEYKDIVNKSEVLKGLTNKYFITYQRNIIDKIINHIKEIIIAENSFLQKVLYDVIVK